MADDEPVKCIDSKTSSADKVDSEKTITEGVSVESKTETKSEITAETDTEHVSNGDKCEREPEVKSVSRIRKWGKFKVNLSEDIRITSKLIQQFYPELKLLNEDEVDLGSEEPRSRLITRQPATEATVKAVRKTITMSERNPMSTTTSVVALGRRTFQNDSNSETSEVSTFGVNRKVSIVEDDEILMQEGNKSPAKNPISNVLFIQNLVRPYTLKQLKDLLSRTGVIVDNGFWTDKIKSKCFVQFQNEEEAELTRNTLHGIQWPVGNGKRLSIDFSTEDEMLNAMKNGNESLNLEIASKNMKQDGKIILNNKKRENQDLGSFEKNKVREWDVGKENINGHQSPIRVPVVAPTSIPESLEPAKGHVSHERSSKRRRSRHRSLETEKPARKQRKKENTPVKHMDDLFKKTKATPCIYWLPLSSDVIAKKEYERMQRLQRHKKRREEAEDRKGKSRISQISSKYEQTRKSSRPKE